MVAFGRATIDLYANEIGPMENAVTFHKYVGGSPANTAVAMSRLGLSVGYIGKVLMTSLDDYYPLSGKTGGGCLPYRAGWPRHSFWGDHG